MQNRFIPAGMRMYLKNSDPPVSAIENRCALTLTGPRGRADSPLEMKKADFSPRKSAGDSRRAGRTEVTYKTPLP